jgi:hypothetical protein
MALIYSRLILGFTLIPLAISTIGQKRELFVAIMVWAILSDIFDGIIARSLKVSNERLRRMDSAIDQIFWIMAMVAAIILCPDFFKFTYIKIIIVLGLEMLCYLISYIRFRKEVATHAILSKIWTLAIVGTLIQIVLTCNSVILFNIWFYLGIITRLEIIAILFILKEWTNDVPGLYQAILLRQGKKIKKHKLFNG